ncbi:MAG TPA: iron-sulfur cluster repair di-iron protein [Salegentibacter sp.]|uniref:iron-sulfur cluster repair di-iron protein n=1 Tax=Salegentibacter sp. TaxID=1903072 RepID=UPI002F925BD0
MNTIKDKTVAELVTDNIKNAHVFKKYGIDFCCGGGEKLETACKRRKVSLKDIERDLLNSYNIGSREYKYNSWELDFLSDHIVNVHHQYIEESIPMMLNYCKRLVRSHAGEHPELKEIEKLFRQLAEEIKIHLKKEELILFPFINKMVKAEKEGTKLERPPFGNASSPVKMMEEEHESAGNLIRKIAELSDGFTPPKGACNNYKAFYSKLDEFEKDLYLHIHLENNILFPKAIALEKKVMI